MNAVTYSTNLNQSATCVLFQFFFCLESIHSFLCKIKKRCTHYANVHSRLHAILRWSTSPKRYVMSHIVLRQHVTDMVS